MLRIRGRIKSYAALVVVTINMCAKCCYIVAKNIAKLLQALRLQCNNKIRVSCQNLAKITRFFTENKYFTCVWDIIIQKQIIYTNFTHNIYKFVTIYIDVSLLCYKEMKNFITEFNNQTKWCTLINIIILFLLFRVTNKIWKAKAQKIVHGQLMKFASIVQIGLLLGMLG